MDRVLTILNDKAYTEINKLSADDTVADKLSKTLLALEMLNRFKKDGNNYGFDNMNLDDEIVYVKDRINFVKELVALKYRYSQPSASKYSSQISTHLWYLKVLECMKDIGKFIEPVTVVYYNESHDEFGCVGLFEDELDKILSDDSLNNANYMILRFGSYKESDVSARKNCELHSKLKQLLK